jgi:hypothetical protein
MSGAHFRVKTYGKSRVASSNFQDSTLILGAVTRHRPEEDLLDGGNSQRAGAKTHRAQAQQTQIHGPQDERERDGNASPRHSHHRGEAGAPGGIEDASYRRRGHNRSQTRAPGGIQDSPYIGVESR